jgi:Universal stress protein family
MKTYQTVVVGTDGSDTSLYAVEQAASIAAASDARLVIATAYVEHADHSAAADIVKDEAYLVRGTAPIDAILRQARERAKAPAPPTSTCGHAWAAPSRCCGRSPSRSTPTCWWSAAWDWTRFSVGCSGRSRGRCRAAPAPRC